MAVSDEEGSLGCMIPLVEEDERRKAQEKLTPKR
jgi:hypothetical protein